MSAAVFEIVEKLKTYPFSTALPENFAVRATGSVDAQLLLDHPQISLYCLDDTKREVWFVETPPEIDLTAAPFYYIAQYDHALRAYVVSYETFHRLAAAVPPFKLILIHSIGRCGSTLISKAFSTVPGVRSISEPDIHTQIYFLRYLDQTRDEEYTALLRSATLLLGKGMTADNPTLALKLRGMCIQVGDLLYSVFPGATHLFLYRHLHSWSRSTGLETHPSADRQLPVAQFPIHRRGMAPLSVPFAAEHGREATHIELAALTWLSLMERYVALCAAGVPFLALRYEDIQAQPEAVLAAIFDYCGLSASVEHAYAVFAQDSQEGTFWSRASRQQRETFPLTEDELARMQELLDAHPLIHAPDYLAPNTLELPPAG